MKSTKFDTILLDIDGGSKNMADNFHSRPFKKINLLHWEQFIKRLFNDKIPKCFEWSSEERIIEILNKFESGQNHTFLPGGGGLDLDGAVRSREKGCIELILDGTRSIIKPKVLSFHSFGEYFEWAYFRLDCEDLDPSGVYDDTYYINDEFYLPYEELTEVGDGVYKDRYYIEELIESKGYESIPKDIKLVTRYMNGAFVIFAKGSTYNGISSTYDGRHNKMTNEQFHAYIQGAVDHIIGKSNIRSNG